MITPSHETDAAPPERGCEGMVFLAGAIKYWWLKKCNRPGCGHINAEDARFCTRRYVSAQTGKMESCNWTGVYEIWGTDEHTEYVNHRDYVRRALIQERFLTYAPHEAFKGTWSEAAQAVNDAGIAASDVMLVLSPPKIPTYGTDDEVAYARRVETPVIYVPPGSAQTESKREFLIQSIRGVING